MQLSMRLLPRGQSATVAAMPCVGSVRVERDATAGTGGVDHANKLPCVLGFNASAFVDLPQNFEPT